MDILLYLTELLQTRKTIGIVGLGTLYKKKSPGKYDAQKHTFLPPSYDLAFTVDIKEQEELANYISNKRNITIESANYYIGVFAEQVQTDLIEKQESDLQNIGKLKYVNDEVILVTNQESTFGFEFYGLPNLVELEPQKDNLINSNADEILIPETAEQQYIEEIDEESKLDDVAIPETEESLQQIEEENKLEEENPGQETIDEVEENLLLNNKQETFEEIAEVENINPNSFENSFVELPIIEAVEAQEKTVPEPVIEKEIIEEEIEEEEPKKGMPFLIKVIFILLFIIAAGAIAYFINPQFFNNYLKNHKGKPVKTIPIAPIDSLNTKTDSLLADSLARNNEMVNLIPDTPTLDSTKTYYEVIGTSERSQLEADKYIARVATIGIKATIAKMPGKRFNISLGTFVTPGPAKILRDSLRIALKNQGIYIQPITPKTHK